MDDKLASVNVGRIDETKQLLVKYAADSMELCDGCTDAPSQTMQRSLAIYLGRADALDGFDDLEYPRRTPTPPPP